MLEQDILLHKIIQTCDACPSQWDAWDVEGLRYYIRYRYGHLTVHVIPEEDDKPIDQWRGILSETIGHGLDGYMTTAQMLDHTGFIVVP